MRGQKLLRDLLARKTPDGYYVIPLRNVKSVIEDLVRSADSIEEIGDVVILKVKSRSLARKIAVEALKRGVLADTV